MPYTKSTFQYILDLTNKERKLFEILKLRIVYKIIRGSATLKVDN